MMAEVPLALDFVSGDDLQAELRVRRPPWLFQTVAKPDVDINVADGWEVAQTNSKTVRLRRLKPIDQALEDEVWSLLARIGFTSLSKGRRFVVPVVKAAEAAAGKQIDVLAADDETALVVECKSSMKAGYRSMSKDLNEVKGIRGAVINALRQHYGIKKKVGWIFATRGVVWGKNDRDRAAEYDITVLTEDEIDYYLRLADLVGPATRHQLQAEVFGRRKIPGLDRAIPAVRGQIAGRRFYQFTIDPNRLLKIAFISHRVRLDAESVGAYQRMLKKNRLASIRRYVDDGGVFPTNVVVNFRDSCRFDASGDKSDGSATLGTLYLPNTYKSAWVIDGQHRLYGFAGSKWAATTQLPVLAFEQLPPDVEARMFVDINSKQVKVPRSLLVDLQSELYWGSDVPQERYHALLSRIVAVLGRNPSSPLRKRVVQEGETQTAETPITVTGAYEALKKTGLVGSIRRGVFVAGALYEADDQTAVTRAVEVLSRYLNLFADALPDHWALGNAEGGYLCTNNGVTALLTVLAELFAHLEKHTGIKPWQATPDELLVAVVPFSQPVVDLFGNANPEDIRSYRRQVGNLGQRRVAFAMIEAINAVKPSFDPVGLDEYKKSQDKTGTNLARQLMPELQLKVQAATLTLLKSKFGEGEAGWWRQGVPAKVRADVAALRESSPDPGPPEHFFDLLDYRSIASANWELFQPYFRYGDGRSKDSQLEWFTRLSILRNRIAHPERGAVDDNELLFIQNLLDHFETAANGLPVLG